MGDKTTDDKGVKPCCKEDKSQEKKLVKATDLPIHGNPYPPKDIIIEERPSKFETKIRDVRTMLQPYVSPIASTYERTSDVLATGYAHSQSAVHRLSENQSSIVSALIIATSGLVGFGLARKRNFFSKLLFGTLFLGGATVACYPKDAEEKAQLLWYIAKNKLPGVATQQYEKLFKKASAEKESTNEANSEVSKE